MNGSTLARAYQTQWERSRALTLRYATSTPSELYAYRPQPDLRTYGEHLIHIFESEQMIWRRFSELETTSHEGLFTSKDAVIAYLERVTSETRGFMANLSNGQWEGLYLTFSGKQIPFFEMLLQQLDHEAHYRGQLAQYLRQNDLTPPEF